MEYEEKKLRIVSWFQINNLLEKFIHNLHKLRPCFDPFTEKELDEFLIANSFVWMNTTEGTEFWIDVDNKYRTFYKNHIMMEKEKSIKIDIPEGYEIDKEKSTFENIVFKKKEERWRAKEHSRNFADTNNVIDGFLINVNSEINEVKNVTHSFPNRNVFFTEKQAKSALAMAQISQIMANDERFGGVVTDEEWEDNNIEKYVIMRTDDGIEVDESDYIYEFLAFHTSQQRDLFLEENEDLVKDYLMIDYPLFQDLL